MKRYPTYAQRETLATDILGMVAQHDPHKVTLEMDADTALALASDLSLAVKYSEPSKYGHVRVICNATPTSNTGEGE